MKKEQYTKTFNEWIDESLDESEVSGLKSLKRGDTVYRLMQRDNPQLGTYYVFNKEIITKITGKAIFLRDGKYDKETGEEMNPKDAVYGSAWYSIMTEEEAEQLNRKLKAEGRKVRGLDESLDESDSSLIVKFKSSLDMQDAITALKKKGFELVEHERLSHIQVLYETERERIKIMSIIDRLPFNSEIVEPIK